MLQDLAIWGPGVFQLVQFDIFMKFLTSSADTKKSKTSDFPTNLKGLEEINHSLPLVILKSSSEFTSTIQVSPRVSSSEV